ncbi:hypothetical protein M4D52_29955 [Paenibacillus lactis]|uniref:hypothetical protein n=1 Tax=Paenibacillus lactis TaxID=228574 RepID=UPI00203C97DA|nr:hypothetical protein [Paenibacillus lactis]MCM3497662.1 hypothetical protein [Paenibacillus lactis]
MVTYGVIVGTVIAAGLVEARCRNGGNVTGALAAQRFGRFFLVGAGLALSWQWIAGMIALLQ